MARNPKGFATNEYVKSLTRFHYDLLKERFASIIGKDRKKAKKATALAATSTVIAIVALSIALVNKPVG